MRWARRLEMHGFRYNWCGTYRVQQALRGGRHDMQRRVHVLRVLAHVQHDALAQRRRARARSLAQHALQLQRVLAVAVRRQSSHLPVTIYIQVARYTFCLSL